MSRSSLPSSVSRLPVRSRAGVCGGWLLLGADSDSLPLRLDACDSSVVSVDYFPCRFRFFPTCVPLPALFRSTRRRWCEDAEQGSWCKGRGSAPFAGEAVPSHCPLWWHLAQARDVSGCYLDQAVIEFMSRCLSGVCLGGFECLVEEYGGDTSKGDTRDGDGNVNWGAIRRFDDAISKQHSLHGRFSDSRMVGMQPTRGAR